MSRGALALAGALLLLGGLIWLLAPEQTVPATAGGEAAWRQPATVPPEAGPPMQPQAMPAPVVVATGKPPRITTVDELRQVLTARGLDAETLIEGYRDWRVARGYLGADPLAGVTAENAPSQLYAAMDRPTQKVLADSGDLGAIQAYAAGSLPKDPFAALKYYSRASELGSAAALGEIATILAGMDNLQPDDASYAESLLALRGGNPDRELRQDAVAWTLASIRQYGPVVATRDNLALVEALDAQWDSGVLTAVCGQSLAILAKLSAATAGKDTGTLPPVFVSEEKLYDRLPCRDTPAPVTPPRALEGCTSSPATGNNSQPVELWICPEN